MAKFQTDDCLTAQNSSVWRRWCIHKCVSWIFRKQYKRLLGTLECFSCRRCRTQDFSSVKAIKVGLLSYYQKLRQKRPSLFFHFDKNEHSTRCHTFPLFLSIQNRESIREKSLKFSLGHFILELHSLENRGCAKKVQKRQGRETCCLPLENWQNCRFNGVNYWQFWDEFM